MEIQNTNLKSRNEYKFRLDTTNISEANLIKRAIYTIDTWAIEYVRFYVNTSERKDEILAMRMGLLPIDNDALEDLIIFGDDEKLYETPFTINEMGPKVVTTADIQNMPFKEVHPIVTLFENQRLHCEVYISKNNANFHTKFNPTACVRIETENNDDGKMPIFFLFKSKGMLNAEKIVEKAFLRVEQAKNEEPFDIFSKPIIPYS